MRTCYYVMRVTSKGSLVVLDCSTETSKKTTQNVFILVLDFDVTILIIISFLHEHTPTSFFLGKVKEYGNITSYTE